MAHGRSESTEDRAAVADDALALVVHDTINALLHAQRLYPDVYARKVADAVRAFDAPSYRDWKFWYGVQADAYRAQCEVTRRWMRKADEDRAERDRLAAEVEAVRAELRGFDLRTGSLSGALGALSGIDSVVNPK